MYKVKESRMERLLKHNRHNLQMSCLRIYIIYTLHISIIRDADSSLIYSSYVSITQTLVPETSNTNSQWRTHRLTALSTNMEYCPQIRRWSNAIDAHGKNFAMNEATQARTHARAHIDTHSSSFLHATWNVWSFQSVAPTSTRIVVNPLARSHPHRVRDPPPPPPKEKKSGSHLVISSR